MKLFYYTITPDGTPPSAVVSFRCDPNRVLLVALQEGR